MSPDDAFNLMVGLGFSVLVFLVLAHYVLKKLFGIDMRIEFYAAQAVFVGLWYDRKELREAVARRRHTGKKSPADT